MVGFILKNKCYCEIIEEVGQLLSEKKKEESLKKWGKVGQIKWAPTLHKILL